MSADTKQETESSAKKVDYRFKLLYAFGMIFVVAGHCFNGGVSLLYEWFPPYMFHLGLFAFASGYFYKDCSEEKPLKYIWKKTKNLLIPLYCWNIFYAVVVSLLSLKGFTIGAGVTLEKLLLDPIMTGHQFIYNLGGWFIIPLFMMEVFNLLFRCCLKKMDNARNKEILIFICYACMGVLGIYLAEKGFAYSWWLVLVRMLYFASFYGLGTFYQRVLEKHDTLPGIVYFSIIGLLQLVVLYRFGGVPVYSPAWFNDFTNGPVLPFIQGYIGIAFWLRVCRILEPVLGKNKYVNRIADNSFSIMINHLLGFMLVKTVFALLSKVTPLMQDFNWDAYKTDIWYFYLPHGTNQFLILYLIAGIVFPICLQKLVNWIMGSVNRKQMLH